MLTVDEVAAALKDTPSTTVTVPGPVLGEGWFVEVDDPDSLRQVLAAGPVGYVSLLTWGPETAAALRTGVADPKGIDAVLAANPIEDGALVSITVDVVTGGVLQRAVGYAAPFAEALAAQAAQQRREEARWRRDERQEWHEYRRYVDARRAAVDWIRAHLPARLVADDAWLTLSTERARLMQARDLVRVEYPKFCEEQKVASAVLDAVAEATRLRDVEVVPERTTWFLDKLEEHARQLASTPPFQAARTKDLRRRLVDAYVASVDPVVPLPAVREQLLAAATSAGAGG